MDGRFPLGDCDFPGGGAGPLGKQRFGFLPAPNWSCGAGGQAPRAAEAPSPWQNLWIPLKGWDSHFARRVGAKRPGCASISGRRASLAGGQGWPHPDCRGKEAGREELKSDCGPGLPGRACLQRNVASQTPGIRLPRWASCFGAPMPALPLRKVDGGGGSGLPGERGCLPCVLGRPGRHCITPLHGGGGTGWFAA